MTLFEKFMEKCKKDRSRDNLIDFIKREILEKHYYEIVRIVEGNCDFKSERDLELVRDIAQTLLLFVLYDERRI